MGHQFLAFFLDAWEVLGWPRELRCDEEDEEDEFRGCTGDSAALAAAAIFPCFTLFTWSMALLILFLLGRPACAFFIDAMTIFVGFMSSSIAAVPLTGKLPISSYCSTSFAAELPRLTCVYNGMPSSSQTYWM